MKNLKDLLHCGDIVQTRNKEFWLVANNKLFSYSGCLSLTDYNNALCIKYGRRTNFSNYDIIAIYTIPGLHHTFYEDYTISTSFIQSQHHSWFNYVTYLIKHNNYNPTIERVYLREESHINIF